jgi:hypothetical protein
VNFATTCTLRSADVVDTSPNVAEVMVCEIGLLKTGVLARLSEHHR